MPEVASLTGVPWDAAVAVDGSPVEVPWVAGTLVTSLGGAYTPGAAPPGSTPSVPNTDADFVIGPGPFYYVEHAISIFDLRDDTELQFDSMSLGCDDGSVCWTLSATGPLELFARFTTGDIPVIEVTVNGNVWRFVIEGVQRSRQFGDPGVSITGRSLTITAGEPYEFPQNWVNDGPATAQQIAAQAQVYNGLEIDFQLDDWLVPSRAFTFTGAPLAVVQRVAESVGAVTKADRLDNRLSLLPRYPSLPNEWREEVPNVEIHLDIVMADSYERADKPAYTGIYVSGETEGQIAHVYLAGTMGDKLAPMVTDALLTEQIALRQRGEAELGKGGPQATVRLTLPVLDETGFPGVFELNWLCRIVEPDGTWYGIVRAVQVNVEFGKVSQTITLERHTADITGTVVPLPPPVPAPTLYLAWRNPIFSPSGTPNTYEANSGTAPYNAATTGPNFHALLVGYTTGEVAWAVEWSSTFADGPPGYVTSGAGGEAIEIQFPLGELDTQTSRGTLLLSVTVAGVPVINRLRMLAVANITTGDVTMTWSSEVAP